MRVLVTGREGQVARSLAEQASGQPDMEVLLAGRPEFDLLKPESIRAAILAAKPDVVVSAAAYTAVDRAEDEREEAFAVNATGAAVVAQAALEVGAAVVHLSTDYVFSGEKAGEYLETDTPDPQNVYGLSKLEGERAVATANPRHVILRTAWVYSPFGRNFVKTMLGLARDRDAIRVVADQIGNPTAATDIAEGVLRAAAAVTSVGSTSYFGIFHLAGEGSVSWAGFAREIFSESSRLGGPFARVEDITTGEYLTKARRPENSRLAGEKFHDTFGWRPPPWQQSCHAVVARLVAEG